MAGKQTAEKPLTLSQLVGFFERAVEPRFERLETQMTEFRNETNARFDDLYKKYSDLASRVPDFKCANEPPH